MGLKAIAHDKLVIGKHYLVLTNGAKWPERVIYKGHGQVDLIHPVSVNATIVTGFILNDYHIVVPFKHKYWRKIMTVYKNERQRPDLYRYVNEMFVKMNRLILDLIDDSPAVT